MFLAGGLIQLTFPKDGQFADLVPGTRGQKTSCFSPADSCAELRQDGNTLSVPASLTSSSEDKKKVYYSQSIYHSKEASETQIWSLGQEAQGLPARLRTAADHHLGYKRERFIVIVQS